MRKVSSEDVETMFYLRDRGFTQKAISALFNVHPTLVEYYTTPGRMEYVRNYAKGRYFKSRVGKMSPYDIGRKMR